MAKKTVKLQPLEKGPYSGSFGDAISGLKLVFKREKHIKVFVIIAFIPVILGFWLGISGLEWLILLIVIGLNFVAELFNTALEVLCDRVTSKKDVYISAVKDISAAAVLVFVITAVLVGIIIFLPKLLTFFDGCAILII